LKTFLSIICLSVIGCLSVSVFSPETHSSIFHGGDHCPHHNHGNPCSSHGEQSSSDEPGTCAVVLFGESTEHIFTLSNSSFIDLLELGVSKHDSKKKYFVERVSSRWARGPPELI
jgi:hypothetical protein